MAFFQQSPAEAEELPGFSVAIGFPVADPLPSPAGSPFCTGVPTHPFNSVAQQPVQRRTVLSNLRLPLSLTMAVGSGLLICLVGFLAWGLPFYSLEATISPLTTSIRELVFSVIAHNIKQTWDNMRRQMLSVRSGWDFNGQPMDPFTEGERLGQLFQPTLDWQPNLISMPIMNTVDNCINMSVLQRHPVYGMCMARQNCTHRWLEGWNSTTRTLTGAHLVYFPPFTLVTGLLLSPLNQTTPSQPFSWLAVFNPNAGFGDIYCANVGLFQPESGAYFGRAGLCMSTIYLGSFLRDQLAGQAAVRGGRLALIDEQNWVVSASHGRTDLNRRFRLAEIGDTDLEAAARQLQSFSGPWCTNISLDVTFSVRYFLDTMVIEDPYVTPQPLRWCAILLSPRQNTMAAVDNSISYAIPFVCSMTIGVMLCGVLLGLFVTRPMKQLTTGMCALKACDFAVARKATGRKSIFKELFRAQGSYDALVDAIDAFGKFVPMTVVRGLLAGTIQPELGMSEKHIALAFMDMENFTQICESNAASEIVIVTSLLFDTCCKVITRHDGTVDKFIGDCIMAVWGSPLPMPTPGLCALKAVIDIRQFLRQTPIQLPDGSTLGLRIGAHCGPCLVGNFGATGRWDYTAIGDVVNTAARLEPLNKQFKTHCLVSGAIHAEALLSPHIRSCLRPMGNVLLIGKLLPLSVYEVCDDPVPELQEWANAVDLFTLGYLGEAAQYFEALPAADAVAELCRDIRRSKGVAPCCRVMKGK